MRNGDDVCSGRRSTSEREQCSRQAKPQEEQRAPVACSSSSLSSTRSRSKSQNNRLYEYRGGARVSHVMKASLGVTERKRGKGSPFSHPALWKRPGLPIGFEERSAISTAIDINRLFWLLFLLLLRGLGLTRSSTVFLIESQVAIGWNR